MSVHFGAWTLHHLVCRPSPCPCLLPAIPAPPLPPGLELSQAQSHGHLLRPSFEPTVGGPALFCEATFPAARCTLAPGAPWSLLCGFHSPGVLGHSTHSLYSWLPGTLGAQGGGLLLRLTAWGWAEARRPGPRAPLASFTAWEACHHLETTDVTLDVIFASVQFTL